MTTRTDDIVGYTYRADNYCPRCVVFKIEPFLDREAWTEGVLNIHQVENLLNVSARGRGINRADERSFDSGEFPKVLFRDQLEVCVECGGEGYYTKGHDASDCQACDGCGRADHCGSCGRVLGA